jgi:hypothetical protein
MPSETKSFLQPVLLALQQKKRATLRNGGGGDLYHKLELAAFTIPVCAAKVGYAFALLYHWLHGGTVSTLNSESSDRGSNPREASAFAGHCHLYIGVVSLSWRAVHAGKKVSRAGYLFGVLVACHKKLRVVSACASRYAHPHSPGRQRGFDTAIRTTPLVTYTPSCFFSEAHTPTIGLSLGF